MLSFFSVLSFTGLLAGSASRVSFVQVDQGLLKPKHASQALHRVSNSPPPPPPPPPATTTEAPPPPPPPATTTANVNINGFGATCDLDDCRIVGDPHLTRFDKKWISLLDITTEEQKSNHSGVKSVVRNAELEVQIVEAGNGDLVRSINVAGNLTDGHTLTITPTSISFKGEQILVDTEDLDATFEYGGVMRAQRTFENAITEHNAKPKKMRDVPGIVFEFSNVDYLKITVNQLNTSLNAIVWVCREDTTWEGQCAGEDPNVKPKPIEPDKPIPVDPQSTCEDSGTCNVYGDPHIVRFDRLWMSLLQTETSQRQGGIQKPGDFWLVQSKPLSIQARFGRNGPMMTHLAVGGDLLKGNVLIIGGMKDEASWNGQQILTKFPSKFASADGLAHVHLHNQTSLVQRKKNQPVTVAGVDVQLPEGVKLIVNRMDHTINVAITMCESITGRFGGYCGNLYGGDDIMMAEDQSMYQVSHKDSLFLNMKGPDPARRHK